MKVELRIRDPSQGGWKSMTVYSDVGSNDGITIETGGHKERLYIGRGDVPKLIAILSAFLIEGHGND